MYVVAWRITVNTIIIREFSEVDVITDITFRGKNCIRTIFKKDYLCFYEVNLLFGLERSEPVIILRVGRGQ